MGSFSTELRALETSRKVIASLSLLADRDGAIDALIADIARDRDRLLRAMLCGGARRA